METSNTRSILSMRVLTDDNFILFASKAYRNPNCMDEEEFYKDLNSIKYLKKLFSSYKKKGTLNERLILNHLQILYNVFESKECTRMLFFKLQEHWDCLVPFLDHLNYLPEFVIGIGLNKEYKKDFVWTPNIIIDARIPIKIKTEINRVCQAL